MASLSICIIVKDEEDVIGRCLSCVKDIANEIIIVDTGSKDKTKEIASQFTNLIYDFEWIQDFSAARNYSFSKATMDYTMWLDADDIISEDNQKALKDLITNLDKSVDMVMMKYDIAFDEDNNSLFSYYRERIVKTSKGYKWIGDIHEVITQEGNVIYSDVAIWHKKIRPNEPDRNLKIFENMINKGKELDPRQLYYFGRELYYNAKYKEAIKIFNKFLDEGKGWIENNISACKDLASCYFMLEEMEKGLASLLRSFIFDKPRAEICCEIGKYFIDVNQLYTAIFWYKLALSCEMNHESGGFVEMDYYGYIPNIQICLCYFKLGDLEKSEEYNNKAGAIKPKGKSYLYNKNFFDNRV